MEIESGKCTFCGRVFDDITGALAHELREHIMTDSRKPKKINNAKNVSDALQELDYNTRPLEVILNHLVFNKTKAFEICGKVKNDLLCTMTAIPDLKVYEFGSITTGLMLNDSDFDISLTTEVYTPGSHSELSRSEKEVLFNDIHKHLQNQAAFKIIKVVDQATVPIIKCRHLPTKMMIDLSCASLGDSVLISRLIGAIFHTDKRLLELMLFLKIWAKHMNLIKLECLSNFSLIALVLFYLQQPMTWNDSIAIIPPLNQIPDLVKHQLLCSNEFESALKDYVKPPLSEIRTYDLIRNFFLFYGDFQFTDNVVSPYKGSAINKDALRLSEQIKEGKSDLNIQDLLVVPSNITRRVTPEAFNHFIRCLHQAQSICQNSQTNTTTESDVFKKLLCDIK